MPFKSIFTGFTKLKHIPFIAKECKFANKSKITLLKFANKFNYEEMYDENEAHSEILNFQPFLEKQIAANYHFNGTQMIIATDW